MNAEKRQDRYLCILQSTQGFGVEERFLMSPNVAADPAAANPNSPLMNIVLASASPRRQEILRQMGVSFEVDAPSRPEPSPDDFPSVELFVTHAAYRKASEIADRRNDGLWILAADTVAELDGEVLGKPADRADAERILRRLIGRRHRTWTGLCLLRPTDRLSLVLAQFSWVVFRKVSEKTLAEYLESGHWEGKAGAYGIQHDNDPFVESLEGSYSNVMGLPVEGVRGLLKCAERLDAVA
jgi:septum formation protein